MTEKLGSAPADKHHPGEGRGPIGKVAVTEDSAQLATSPNWAPASAGVDVPQLGPGLRRGGGA